MCNVFIFVCCIILFSSSWCLLLSIVDLLVRIDRGFGYWKLLSGKYREVISLWHHSLMVADISYNLAGLLGLSDRFRVIAFLAGFLHDYAKSVGDVNTKDIREYLSRLFSDLLPSRDLELVYSLATHVEAGPQPVNVKLLMKTGISPRIYDDLSMILSMADALASINSIYEFEKAFIMEDEEYWIREHRWKRYIEILKELKKRGIIFESLRLTLHTHPIIRALIIHTILREYPNALKIYYRDGVALITNKPLSKYKTTPENAEKLARRIIETIQNMPYEYVKPPQGTPVTIDVLMGKKSVNSIIEYYSRLFEKIEDKGEIKKTMDKIIKGVEKTAKKLIPRKQLPSKTNIETLEDLREILYRYAEVKEKIDVEYLEEYIYHIVYRYYLGGSLVDRKLYNKTVEIKGNCYLCGEPLVNNHYYPFYTALASRANLQVKYWFSDQKPLVNLDKYLGDKYKLCPLCHFETHVKARLEGRQPYLIIKYCPVMTDLVAEYTDSLFNTIVWELREPINELLKRLKKRMKIVEDRPLYRRLMAIHLFYSYQLMIINEVINDIVDEIVKHDKLDPLEYIRIIYNVIYDKLIGERIIIGEEVFDNDVFIYSKLSRYNLELVLPLASNAFNTLGIRKKSFEVSKTVSVGLSPILAIISILTGGQVLVSDHIGVWKTGYAVYTPNNVFPNAVFYDVSGKKKSIGLPLSFYLFYVTPILVAFKLIARLREVDAEREFMRLYSSYTSQPLLFSSSMRLLQRILFYIDRPEKFLRELTSYIRLVEVSSEMSSLEEYSPRLISILNELVDWMNKYHYVQTRTKHGYIAPLNRAFESLLSKLSLIDKLGIDTLVELASTEFAERVRRDVEARGYHASPERLAEGIDIVKKLLKLLLEIYLEEKDTRVLRDLVNDIYNYVFIKRLIHASESRKKSSM